MKIHRELGPSSASHFSSSKSAKSESLLRYFEMVTQQSPKSVLFRSPVDAQPVGYCVLLCPPPNSGRRQTWISMTLPFVVPQFMIFFFNLVLYQLASQ